MIPATAPVAAGERMTVLDAVRGVAVLGILLINIDALSGYAFTPAAARASLPLSQWDGRVWFVQAVLIEAKFYSLFSFLFGVGFAVFVGRAAARGNNPRALFKRRLVGLMLIGIVHTLLIWYGDILLTYGLLGFALVPFLERSDRTVLRWAAAMLLAPIALYSLMLLAAGQAASRPVAAPGGTSPDRQEIAAADDPLPPIMRDAAAEFAHGSYFGIVQGNVVFTAANVIRRLLLMFFPRVLGMFLLGFYAGRRNMFADIRANRVLLRRVMAAGFLLGLPLTVAGALWGDHAAGPPSLHGLIETVIESIGVPLLALAYAAGLCVLFDRVPALMRTIAPVGRMALSNYVMHSVAGVIIFYGLGFGLFGRVSLLACLIGAVAAFTAQMLISRWWLDRAHFGPAEWLWRMFTYRRRFPLMKEEAPTVSV